ncbi:type IX secretion system sortase PorU [Litoribacter alkaliphilus]|uniref:Type IX secretion system sortase PorU n=1 Tax=Litoribacter ruber TaxID=702568 RepID=A0AAP2G3F7_9BACT|nr:type IX secretion system sortase PorU [Litoribacter alkaliphilus]MBS9522951.1 type IX secretion system sortase PorU [Litoribacter alkaliphilus]
MGKFRPYHFLFLLITCLAGPFSLMAQSSYFKFPITEEGIYKITSQQASQLGGDISQLRILGYQGSLPSELDSSFATLNEIPAMEINGELYFYASGPHFTQPDLEYHHHPYSDTLYYLIQTGLPPERQIETVGSNHQGEVNTLAYKLFTKKEETHNLLNSGRQWWGNRSLNGQLQNLFFNASTASHPIYYDFNLLGQSVGSSSYTFRLNDEEVEQLTFEAIPNSTYGIKGRTARSSGFHSINASTGVKASFLYQSSNPNGMGYIDYVTIGLPEVLSNQSTGIYHLLNSKQISAPAGKYTWSIEADGNIQNLESGLHPLISPKIALFDQNSVKAISSVQAADMQLNNEALDANLLIITVPLLQNQARRLAEHRSRQGIKANVVVLPAIYDAYGYGNRDIAAIRNFIAREYHQNGQLQHVLLMGKGTFDYKGVVGGRPNLIPTFTSKESLNPLATYSTDDYFAQLDFSSQNLQIGVGRLPAINVQEAVNMVDKLIAYDNVEKNSGEWQRKVLLFADDGDNHLHLNDSERHAAFLHENHPELVLDKLYLDNFEKDQKNNRYPAAAKNLIEKVREGVLLINFVGHGNEEVLTAEQVFHVSQLDNWPTQANLPILVTATCEFGRQDSPFLRSGAEQMLTRPGKGAIALLTTGRPVFSSSNYAINRAFLEAAFLKPYGENLTLGEIYKETKNTASTNQNNQSFSLIGDPSMRIALPELTASKPDLSIAERKVDTLSTFENTAIEALITDPLTGSHLTNFNGSFILSIYGQPESKETLGNIETATTYLDENQTLFRGVGKIENGVMKTEIMLPEVGEAGDILLKIFAHDETGESAFSADKLLIQNQGPPSTDSDGPKIRFSLFDSETHRSIIPSTQSPLFIYLEDESGIFISEKNPAWQPRLTLNRGSETVLAQQYRAKNNSYKTGVIATVLDNLIEGVNTLEFSAYDNHGNISTATLEFVVEGSRNLQILSQMIYPNPASSSTQFRLQHNRPGQDLSVEVKVYNLWGGEIFTYSKRYPHANAELDDLEWIFLHTKTKYPAKGTYIYKLELRSEADGTSDSKSGKLIIQ